MADVSIQITAETNWDRLKSEFWACASASISRVVSLLNIHSSTDLCRMRDHRALPRWCNSGPKCRHRKPNSRGNVSSVLEHLEKRLISNTGPFKGRAFYKYKSATLYPPVADVKSSNHHPDSLFHLT